MLADRLGVPQSTIARWERGRARPSLERVRDAVRACGLELELALTEVDHSLTPLIDEHLRMTPAERLAQNTHMVNLIEGARARTAASADG